MTKGRQCATGVAYHLWDCLLGLPSTGNRFLFPALSPEPPMTDLYWAALCPDCCSGIGALLSPAVTWTCSCPICAEQGALPAM